MRDNFYVGNFNKAGGDSRRAQKWREALGLCEAAHGSSELTQNELGRLDTATHSCLSRLSDAVQVGRDLGAMLPLHPSDRPAEGHAELGGAGAARGGAAGSDHEE